MITMRKRKKLQCFFGIHSPDFVKAEVGGRNVQRCLYCDRILREYTITTDNAKKTPIMKRIY